MPHTDRSPRQLTITQLVESPRDEWHRGQRVPMIRMRGEWLEENGFSAGARVVITVERGRIVLTLAGEVKA
jgi:hypothetical protein